MKKKTKIIISVLSIVLSLSLILSGVSFLCFRKDSDNNRNVAGAEIKDPVINAVISLTGRASFTMTTGQLIGEDNNENGCAVFVGNGSTFTMTGGTISNFQAENGAGIYVAAGGTCTIKGGTLKNLTATGSGGAIYVATGGTLLIEEATGKTIKFINCNAEATKGGGGGAIYNASIINNKITGVEFSMCKSSGNGGALYNSGMITCSSITIDGGNNTATSIVNGMYGGAIYNSTSLFLISSEIKNCKAAEGGGALYNGGLITCSSITIDGGNNKATSIVNGKYGGAIYNSNYLDLTSSVIKNCKASEGGGAICVNGGETNIYTKIEFNNCKVGDTGNAIHFYSLNASNVSNAVVKFDYFTANKNETITNGSTATFIESGGYPRFYNGTANATNSIITGSPSIADENASILPLNPGNNSNKLYNWNLYYFIEEGKTGIFTKNLTEIGIKEDVSAGYWLDKNYLDPVDVENISTTTYSNPKIKKGDGIYQTKYTVKITKDGQELDKELRDLEKYTITENILKFEEITRNGKKEYAVWCNTSAEGTIGVPKRHFDSVTGKYYDVTEIYFCDKDAQNVRSGSEVFPSYYNNIKSGFKGCSKITHVYLPSTITNIPNCAFQGCKSLEYVNIHNNITSIKDVGKRIYSFAFRGCTSLKATIDDTSEKTSFNINKVSSLGYGIFYESGVQSFIDGGNETNTIVRGNELFATTPSTTGIPSGVEVIGSYAFSVLFEGERGIDCSGIKEILTRGFFGCEKLNKVTLSDNLTWLGSSAFCKTAITQISIPETVTTIGSYVFDQCTSLEEVQWSDNFNEIPVATFRGCSSLKSVYCGTADAFNFGLIVSDACSVNKILFYVSSGEIDSEIYSESTAYISDNYRIYYDFTKTEYINSYEENMTNMDRAVKIKKDDKEKVTEKLLFWQSSQEINIESYSGITKLYFCGNKNITKLKSYKNLTIPQYAFYNCSNLQSVVLYKVKKISNNAFYCCSALEKVQLSDVTTIGESAFSYGSMADAKNTSLTTVYMPNVQTIGDHAFRYQTRLEYSYFFDSGNGPQYTDLGLPNLTSLGNWAFSDTSFQYVGSEALQTIGIGSFYGCLKLTNISFSNVTKISDHAFSLCENLKTANIKNVEEIGGEAFLNCSSLKSSVDGDYYFYLDNVKEIKNSAFKGCSSLQWITMKNVETIGEQAFYECILLEGTDKLAGGALDNLFPYILELHNATSIGSQAFYYTDISYIECKPTVITNDNLNDIFKHSVNENQHIQYVYVY